MSRLIKPFPLSSVLLVLTMMITGCAGPGRSATPPPAKPDASSSTGAGETGPTEARGDNLFRFDAVKPGDVIAGLTVRWVGPVDESGRAAGPLDPTAEIPNASVEFSGLVTLTGQYTAFEPPTPEEILEAGYYNPLHRVCLGDLDAASLARLPRMAGDDRATSFCFSNPDEAAAALGQGTAGMATVVIDDYDINVFPSEVVNFARLVEVKSLTSLPLTKDILLPTEAGEEGVPHKLLYWGGVPFWTYVAEDVEVAPIPPSGAPFEGLRLGTEADFVEILFLPEGTTRRDAEAALAEAIARHFGAPDSLERTAEDLPWALGADFLKSPGAGGYAGYARLIEHGGRYFAAVSRWHRSSETSAAARRVLFEEWRWKDTGEFLVPRDRD